MEFNFSTGLTIWMPAIDLDDAGMPRRADAGPQERSIVRFVAGMLAHSGRRTHPIVPTTTLADGSRVWMLNGRAWTVEESYQAPDVTGDTRIAFGTADLGENCKLNYTAVDRSNKSVLWQGSIERSRDDFPQLLVLFARALDATIHPQRAPLKNEAWLSVIPTKKPRALWHAMELVDAREALDLKIPFANPQAMFDACLKATAADPGNLFIISHVMELCIRWIAEKRGESAPVYETLRKTAELNPSIARLDAAVAECRLAEEQYDLALAEALKYNNKVQGPESAHAAELAGRIYEKMDDPAKAASSFRRAVQVDARRSVSWQHLGFLAVKLNKWEEAETCLARACEAMPGNRELEEKLSRVRAEVLKIREQRGPLKPG
ncbi:MAG: hypothetical protein HY286_05890 [Planctomycetes bacterium]|nr:hypothetical protein [Planctomycetota bacterium]